MSAVEHTDSELVARSLAGERDAFSRIVSRYQILICSLAYSRLGNLGQSEDVAQETFITAWKHLRLLREPAKLRSWLCGIVRNRLHKHVQRETREPASYAEPLETLHESPAAEALPCEQTIGREEEAILWRALERMPEQYREPLILFYRHHQSVEQVAVELELTGDAVKQRLSRGRKLLQEEVQAFVEKTLRLTAPGRNFSGAVLAALPLAPSATVGLGLAGKGAAAAKSGFIGVWLAPLAPFLGILAGLVSQWLLVRATSTGRERRRRTLGLLAIFILMPASAVLGEYLVGYCRLRYEWSAPTTYLVRTVFWWGYAVGLGTWLVLQLRKMQAAYQHCEATGEIPSSDLRNLGPGAQIFSVLGLNLTMYAWLISLAYRAQDHATAGIIAVFMLLMDGWCWLRSRAGNLAVARAGITHMTLYGLLILAVLNLRVDVWMATARGVSLAEVHALFPPWIIGSLSLALTAWIAIFWTLTKPKPQV